MATLYELSDAYKKAFFELEIDEETGEILNPEVLEKASHDLEDKADNIACYVKDLLARVKAIKDEETALNARRKALENKADKLSLYLAETLLGCNRERIETVRNKITFRKSESVEIFDESKIPAEFTEQEIKIKYDKMRLKKAIKNGAEIEGAVLVEKQNIQIK